MSVENRIDYLKFIIEKLRTCSFIDNVDNVQIGESAMLDQWRDDHFPYIQVQPYKNGDTGYGDTAQFLDMDFEIAVQGFIRRPLDDTVDDDIYNVMRFEAEVNKLIFSLHSEIQAGSIVIPTFEQLAGFSSAYFDYETFEKTSMFMFNFTGKFYQSDNS